jgi:hemerythrin-like metal-binding protein
MSYFEWADDMVVDHGSLDADHMKAVDLLNELHSATTLGQGREVVGPLLAKLVTASAEHIEREEQFMAAINFPGLSEHQLGHIEFMLNLEVLQEKYERGCITVASQLSTVLRDWVSVHIRRYDKQIYFFMQKMALESSRQSCRAARPTPDGRRQQANVPLMTRPSAPTARPFVLLH